MKCPLTHRRCIIRAFHLPIYQLFYTDEMKYFISITILMVITLWSCTQPKESIDTLVTNAKVYTVNGNFEIAEAFAINEGKIIEVGTSEVLSKKYQAKENYDAEGKTILPGLIDGHAHIYNLGVKMQQIDLVGTQSKEEVLQRVLGFQKEKNTTYLLGRGWDQNDWLVKEYPTKEDLDVLFPDTPVALTRIDGHALWANSKALQLAKIKATTKMDGGEVVLKNGEPSGILIDNPMELVTATFPKSTKEFNIQALKDAEKKCISLGLTTVNDAGLDKEIIQLIDEMQQAGDMDIRIYAMISNTPENLDYYLPKGIQKTDRLHVRAVKVYADGALGSRGAAMRESYSDKENHFGAMITPMAELQSLANKIAAAGYQMNTHAIGDSANVSVLRAYKNALKNIKDARWKVEHAQVVSVENFKDFTNNIIPSVQPTHATSDMYWAEDRIGENRIKGAYAYKALLNNAGSIVLGTDFPVEKVNPMHTFYASVARKDLKSYPTAGFRKEDALTREETLKGMTIWAAMSNFEENEKGSIEAGKFADFVVLDTNIMKCPENEIPNTKIINTFINGEKVY